MAIYDCFTFFNELRLLRFRLDLLAPYVDRFVLVEMARTHCNEPKRCHFAENRELFRPYLNKIIYVCPTDLPLYIPSDKDNWGLENFQRNCIMRGLSKAQEEDIILISDADEIPNPTLLLQLPKLRDKLKQHYFVCSQKYCCYYMNCQHLGGLWQGTVISLRKNIISPQICRNMRNMLPGLPNGGWHFSYLGNWLALKTKAQAIVEGHILYKRLKAIHTAQWDEKSYLENCIEQGQDIYGRKEVTFHLVSPDSIGLPNLERTLKMFPEFFKLNT